MEYESKPVTEGKAKTLGKRKGLCGVKNFVRFGIVIFVVVFFGIIFTACSNSAEPTPEPDPKPNISPEQPPTAITYTLSYSVGEGGTVTGKTTQVVEKNKDGEAVTAVPNEGYEFVKWSDGKTTAERTDNNVTSNITATAEFQKKKIAITYASGDGGSVVGNANQTVGYGDDGETVTAVPNEGYEFVKWSDGKTTAERTDNNVTSNITATAEFQKKKIAITYTAGDGGSVVGKANQTVEYGDDGEAVTAVPNEGYVFVGWSDGGASAERKDRNIRTSFTAVAEFEEKGYVLTYLSGYGGGVLGQTVQSVKEGGDGEEVVAQPNGGYGFVKWSDGITTRERIDLNITEDITVTAEFEKISDPAIDEILSFSLFNNNTEYKVQAKDRTVTEVVIPAYYNGLPVTKINNNGFAECTQLKTIEIPDSVVEIGDNAFYGCKNLISVKIPNSVTRIGNSIFGRCTGLEYCTLPNSIEMLGASIFSFDTAIVYIRMTEEQMDALNPNWKSRVPEVTIEVIYIGNNDVESADNGL